MHQIWTLEREKSSLMHQIWTPLRRRDHQISGQIFRAIRIDKCLSRPKALIKAPNSVKVIFLLWIYFLWYCLGIIKKHFSVVFCIFFSWTRHQWLGPSLLWILLRSRHLLVILRRNLPPLIHIEIQNIVSSSAVFLLHASMLDKPARLRFCKTEPN